MFRVAETVRAGRAIAALTLAVFLAACAQNQNELGDAAIAGGGVAGPGSVQEFQVTVGDRVFFETDSSDLTAAARATLDRQAQWLLLYPQYGVVTPCLRYHIWATIELTMALERRALRYPSSLRSPCIRRSLALFDGLEAPICYQNGDAFALSGDNHPYLGSA